jgi:short subunit dehydrogenase-like uncharacterized protein
MANELANAHNTPWAFYGATGVTGRMILERALARGHRPTLIGRDQRKLDAAAAPHDLKTIRADLDEPETLARVLAGHRLVLNAAGPFRLTAEPLSDAAIAAGIDYIDVNGELLVLERLLNQHARAADRGVALVGGAGFGVAAADGLIAQVVGRLGGIDALRISVAADSAFKSDAVTESTLEVIAGGGYEIDSGRLVRRAMGRKRWHQSGDDQIGIAFASAPLAELAAALHIAPAVRVTAGVPMAPTQAFAVSMISPLVPLLLRVPSIRRLMARAGGHTRKATKTAYASRVWVDAQAANLRISAHLICGEGFATAADIAFSAVAAALIARPKPGAHTPATAFGPDFIAGIPGTVIRIAQSAATSF